MPDIAEPRTAAASALRARGRGSGPGVAELAAIAAGGGLGSVIRYLLSQAFPAGQGFPWAILAINVSGCLALGVLMVYVLDVWPPRRLLRPFLAIGLIGGYTTFSTYAAGVLTLIRAHALALADAYALTSVLAGLVAVWCGVAAARRMSGGPDRGPPGRDSADTGGADTGGADTGGANPDRTRQNRRTG
ncbi:MAG TPA: fluoride efflux transporter CrcB [Streptosporangiaceae bacterium]|nr:fluoride efflux transporter CrcB [Streptosporangiaceae bacterium]